MLHDVAGEQGPQARPLQQVADAARRVPRRGDDPEARVAEAEHLIAVQLDVHGRRVAVQVGHVERAEERLPRPALAERRTVLAAGVDLGARSLSEGFGPQAVVGVGVGQEDGLGAGWGPGPVASWLEEPRRWPPGRSR